MSLGIAAARRKNAATQPNEFNDDFTTKSAATINAGVQSFVSDSGHTYFATGTATGAFKASPKDSTMVYTLSATSGTGANYLCASLGGIVYGWARMRFVSAPSQSTHNSAGGLIPWNNITPNGNANSGAHCVITENELYFQKVDNGTTFTTVGGGSGTWGYTDPVEAWFEVEWAIKGNDLVVRLPDGTTHTYNDASLSGYIGNWLCVEPVRNSSTDWTVEYAAVKGSTLEGMNDAQLLYYNNLLAAQSIGAATKPAVPISGSPVLVAIGGASVGTSGNANPSFVKVSDGTAYTCVLNDFIVKAEFNDDTQTLPVGPSGYSTLKSQQNGAACSLIAFGKTAAGGETNTGAPASGTAGDAAIALVFQSCGGAGGNNSVSETTALHAVPVIASLTNSPAGKSRKLYLFGRRGLATAGTAGIDAPVGMTVAKTQDAAASGSVTAMGAYLSYSNFTSDAAATFSDAAGSQIACGISIELLGV